MHPRPVRTRITASLLALFVVFGAAACGDDPGEDELGDGEVIDDGD